MEEYENMPEFKFGVEMLMILGHSKETAKQEFYECVLKRLKRTTMDENTVTEAPAAEVAEETAEETAA